MNIPKIDKVDRTDLRRWTGVETGYYRVSPDKGARIDGTFAVYVSSHEIASYTNDYREKVTAPCLVVDLTPDHVDADGRHLPEGEPLTINGKEYAGGWLSVRANFHPEGGRNTGEPVTIDGQRGYLWTEYGASYDTFSDAARKLVDAAIVAIALDYMTTERWLACQHRAAVRVVNDARAAVSDAQNAETVAETELAKLIAHAARAGVTLPDAD